jgi:hypothetical protein
MHVGLPDALYRRHEGTVALRPGAAPVRLAQQRRVPPIARRGDLQDLADRLDPEGVTMLVDESLASLLHEDDGGALVANAADQRHGLVDFRRREARERTSVGGRAPPGRKTRSSFRISLARRNSLTSRSSSFIRWASPVVTPSLTPLSTSSHLTLRSASAAHSRSSVQSIRSPPLSTMTSLMSRMICPQTPVTARMASSHARSALDAEPNRCRRLSFKQTRHVGRSRTTDFSTSTSQE